MGGRSHTVFLAAGVEVVLKLEWEGTDLRISTSDGGLDDVISPGQNANIKLSGPTYEVPDDFIGNTGDDSGGAAAALKISINHLPEDL